MSKLRRVVITGLGAVTPLGHHVSTFWEQALAGASGAGPITRFDASQFKTRLAAEVKGFDPATRLDRATIKRADLYTQFALYAAEEAITDSGLDLQQRSPFEVGVIWGTGQGGLSTFEEEVKQYVAQGTPRFSPFLVPRMIANMAAGMIAMRYGYQGINYTTVSACATGNNALMDAFNYIRLGKATAFVTGGSEAPITEASLGGFTAMKAMSTANDQPETASRPFDIARDGFVMGEGGAALVLEEYEHARKRGGTIYAEMVGAAMTSDAYHLTATHPEGLGAAKAMELALAEARLNPAEVDYLNAHATSTPVGDLSEVRALERVFGAQLDQIQVSATKSMTGHLLGAAGAIEAVLSIKAISEGVIPPTINTTKLDAAIPKALQLVTGEAREQAVNVAMSNTFGFGGHNAIVLFKKI